MFVVILTEGNDFLSLSRVCVFLVVVVRLRHFISLGEHETVREINQFDSSFVLIRGEVLRVKEEEEEVIILKKKKSE